MKSNTTPVKGASISTFAGEQDAVDLVEYNDFAKEILKPTSETMIAFRKREGVQVTIISNPEFKYTPLS